MYLISDILFFFFYYGIKYRRKITRKNLIESFPQKKISEIIKIEKRFYHFLLDYFFETCKIATLSEIKIKKRMKFINLNILNEAFNEGKSISLYIGHYCNWEWLSTIAIHLDKSILIGQIYRKINHTTFNRIMLTIRGRFGAFNIEMGEVARWLKINEGKQKIVSYIADQTPPWNNIHHWVKFLHHDTPVFTGAEKITKKNKYDSYFLEMYRTKRGYYEAKFIKLFEVTSHSSQLYPITTLYFEQLEKTILRQPEHYLWTHNRFKRTKQKYNEYKIHHSIS